jgi:hypothetical protein
MVVQIQSLVTTVFTISLFYVDVRNDYTEFAHSARITLFDWRSLRQSNEELSCGGKKGGEDLAKHF